MAYDYLAPTTPWWDTKQFVRFGASFGASTTRCLVHSNRLCPTSLHHYTTVTAASRPPSCGPSWAKQHGICIPWLQWVSWVWVSVPRHLISRISHQQPEGKWFGQTCFTTKRQSQRVHPLHQPDLLLQPRQVLPRRSWDLQVTRGPTKNRLGMQEISSGQLIGPIVATDWV
jgi:hypothetical protein